MSLLASSGETEVSQLDVTAAIEKNVIRFNITVDEYISTVCARQSLV